jgi:acyl dehydratase
MTAVAAARPGGPPDVGAVVGPLPMFLSLQRLIMVSGANRDYAMAHVDNEAARAGGAESAYADIMFVFTMIDRLLLEWAGPSAVIRRMGPVKMHDFVLCGFDLSVEGTVAAVSPARLADGRDGLDVEVDVRFVQRDRRPVTGQARVWLPA